MQLSGHDIRMKEFRRAFLRGYAEADVDDFLMALAVEIDQRDRELHTANGAPTHGSLANGSAVDDAAKPSPDRAAPMTIDEATARSVAEVIEQARTAALEIQAEAIAGRDAIEAEARRAAQEIIDHAKANAQRGLTKARQRAEEMLQHARERQDAASRTDAEAQLRLAHIDRELSERAAALSREAQRLDELAGWIAEHDLAPEPESHHVPAHAAPDVVQFRSS